MRCNLLLPLVLMYPFSQAKFQEFNRRSDLHIRLDAYKAIVLGASLHAANLSDGIKLNSKLCLIDDSLEVLVVGLERSTRKRDTTKVGRSDALETNLTNVMGIS
ncbi:heat shock 70 kDa protein 17 [Tanacetum coccineum]